MRRDERAIDPADGAGELEAIEAEWTRVWAANRDLRNLADHVPRREEFRVIWPYLRRLPRGSRVLDGGCGLGEWVAWLTRAGYPTLGLELSAATVARLREQLPSLEFAVGDIRATGLPDASFEAYVSFGTFEHFQDGLDAPVAEAFRLLAPGGLLFVSTPFDNLRHSLRAVLSNPRRVQPCELPTRFYQWRLTRGELASALARHGFSVEEVRIIAKREGLRRTLQHTLRLDPAATLTRAIARGLSPLVPAVAVGHMILAVARRPETARL